MGSPWRAGVLLLLPLAVVQAGISGTIEEVCIRTGGPTIPTPGHYGTWSGTLSKIKFSILGSNKNCTSEVLDHPGHDQDVGTWDCYNKGNSLGDTYLS